MLHIQRLVHDDLFVCDMLTEQTDRGFLDAHQSNASSNLTVRQKTDSMQQTTGSIQVYHAMSYLLRGI